MLEWTACYCGKLGKWIKPAGNADEIHLNGLLTSRHTFAVRRDVTHRNRLHLCIAINTNDRFPKVDWQAPHLNTLLREKPQNQVMHPSELDQLTAKSNKGRRCEMGDSH